MVALMNETHPLAKNPSPRIDVKDLIGEPIIVPSRKAHVETISKWFKKLGHEPRIVCEMDNYLDAAALAGQNVGISIFPKTGYILNNSLVSKELVGAEKKSTTSSCGEKGIDYPRSKRISSTTSKNATQPHKLDTIVFN